LVQPDGTIVESFYSNKLGIWAVCDPAASASKTADFTVISLFNVSPNGNLVWRACYRRQIDIPEQPQLLNEVRMRYDYKFIGIETVASNRGMFQHAQKMGLNAVPLNPSGRDKLSHAQTALILARAGGLWLPAHSQVAEFPMDAVEMELLSFTGDDKLDDHDDIVDTLSYAAELKQDLQYLVGGGTSTSPMAYDKFAQIDPSKAAAKIMQNRAKPGEGNSAFPTKSASVWG
jgi:phage terminase large subunit-like protein